MMQQKISKSLKKEIDKKVEKSKTSKGKILNYQDELKKYVKTLDGLKEGLIAYSEKCGYDYWEGFCESYNGIYI